MDKVRAVTAGLPAQAKFLLLTVLSAATVSAAAIKTLIIQGQSNPSHDMKAETVEAKKILDYAGLFVVEVTNTPAKGQDMSGFRPDFSAYDLVVVNYDGDRWPTNTEAAFEKYVQNGGGPVVFQSADNAFGGWKGFNQMIGLRGWGGRNAKSGPYLRFRDGKWVTGPAGAGWQPWQTTSLCRHDPGAGAPDHARAAKAVVARFRRVV